jgi:autotransporter translocation and assembly factor TamB
MRRAATVAFAVVGTILLLLGGAYLVLTRSGFGRERVRMMALDALRGSVNGRVEIGRIEGNVLGRFTLRDVRITDSAGQPFVAAERVTATLDARGLLSRRVALSDVTIDAPRVHLTKTPDDPWNYARIFHQPGPPGDDSSRGFGDWIRFSNVTLRNGEFVIQRPWAPDADLKGALRDSVIREAMAGRTRARVDHASYGMRQTMEFTAISAVLTEAVIADPEHSDILLQFDSLATLAKPFHPPFLDLRHFDGEVRVGVDTVDVPSFTMRLPGTRATGALRYMLGTGDVFGEFRLDTVAFSDLRLIYPPLPENGGGRAKLVLALRDTGSSEYRVTRADLRVGNAQLMGRLGLVISDSITSLRDTELEFRQLPTALLEQIVPAARLPLKGELTGRGTIDGPIEAMLMDADANFRAYGHAPFRFRVRGMLGARGAFSANRLLVRVEHVPTSLAREFTPNFPIGGSITAQATLTGSTASRIGGPYQLLHSEGRSLSRINGDAQFHMRRGLDMDVGMRFAPLSLELLEHFATKTDFQGNVEGTGHLRGTPRDLAGWLRLTLPDSGTLNLEGTYALPRGGAPAYRATLALQDVNVQAVVPALPTSTLEGTAELRGSGRSLETLEAELASHLRILTVDSVEFRDVVVRARAGDGLVTLDTLTGTSSFGAADVKGTLGLVESREGSLQYRVEVSDLGGLARWIATGDTGSVAARPLIGARLARFRARADSLERAAQMEQNPAAALAADIRGDEARPGRGDSPSVQAIPRDSIGGSLLATGEARGSVRRLDLSSAITTPGLVWGGSLLGAGRVDVRWTDVGSPEAAVAAEGGVDSLRVAGFALDSTRFRGTYRGGDGDVELALFPGDTAEYRLGASYSLRANAGEVRLRDVKLRFDSTAWHSTRAATVNWRGRGFQIDSLELRDRDGRGGGRIFINGEMPDVDPGRLEIAVDSVRLAPWLTLAQTDVPVDGVLALRGTIDGTRFAPGITASVSVASLKYQGTAFPPLAADLDYRDRSVRLDARFIRATGGELARITGRLPIDLSLGDSVVTRLIDAPLAVTVDGDSIPLSPLGELTDIVTGVEGRAFGHLAISGTWKEPHMRGDMGLDVSRVHIPSTGMEVADLTGRLRMTGDTLTIDSLAGHAEGTVRATGRIILAEVNRPILGVDVQADEARVLRNDKGSLVASGRVRADGPIDSLTVTGDVAITHGVINIPDPEQRHLISTQDPAIFAVIDTATARRLDLDLPSPVTENLRVDVNLEVERGVFARSADANVEVYGDLGVRIDPTTRGKFAVRGALYTDQGYYTFMSKRFVITRGSVRFTGEPDPNPVLQVLATYEVRQAGRAPLDIRVIIGGTLDAPNLTLESESQPTLSQSDLIAFLAFGQSSTALLQFTNTGLEANNQNGSSIAGNVGAVATRQLASVAVNALVEQARSDLARATRADVLNITPAQVPGDLSALELQTLIRGTEVELGKYLDHNTFLLTRFRPSGDIPGVSVERRMSDQFRVRASFESRLQPQQPTLSSQLTPTTVNVFGMLLRWSISW